MSGLLRVASNTDLDREAEEKYAHTIAPPAEKFIDGLTAHVKKCFGEALTAHEKYVKPRLIECQKQRAGEYEDSRLAEITKQGGTKEYFNITETKCEAFESWLREVLSPVNDRPWDLAPSPIPDLPEDEMMSIRARVIAEFEQQIMETTDGQVSPELIQTIQDATLDMYDEILDEKVQEAKERSTRMATLIQDQFVEGGYYDALDDFVQDLSTYPTAIFKGPVIKNRKRLAWKDGQPAVTFEPIPTFSAVSPHDFFPGPNARTVHDSFMCERCRFDKAELSELRDLPGYKKTAIDEIISADHVKPTNSIETSAFDSQRDQMENRDTTLSDGNSDSTIEGVEYWGKVQGKLLIEWGMKKERVPDENSFYEVQAILVGDNVIKAMLNPDPLGRRPYDATSFIKVRNTLWGRAIPEKMRDVQNTVNACHRALINNSGLTTGPQCSIDISAVHPSTIAGGMKPWKIWPYDGKRALTGRKPVEFWQPESNAQELMLVMDKYEIKADDKTLIPRYTYGNDNIGGAGDTASGLSMMLNAAAKGIKRVIAHLDKYIIRPSVGRQHAWNMLYHDDPNVKGDSQVLPKGAMAMLVKEQLQLRRQEFLNLTNNPVDLQIVGLEGRATVLREVAKGLEMPVDDIIPDKEKIMQRVNDSLNQQANEAIPPPNPKGGTDVTAA